MMFSNRHIGPNEKEIKKMLSKLGLSSVKELIYETIPNDILLKKELKLDDAISEDEFNNLIRSLSKKNKLFKNYIGLGYHPSIMPAVIQRNILENPGWYTAYTPYQAEIAQGRLEALFNFQSLVCDLTGMKISNASLLDEGTAAAEAMSMFFSTRNSEKIKKKCIDFFVDKNTFPQTISVMKTRAKPLGIKIHIGDPKNFKNGESFFGAFFQYQGKSGNILNISEISSRIEIPIVIGSDLLALTLLEAPGKFNVDAVVGTSQRFGIPLGYGGPHAAFFATKEMYKRNIPGRIIGRTVDIDGNPALRMALQTREQHIKRGRATSNICTAQVLLAVMAGMYAVYHGPKGLKKIALDIHHKAKKLDQLLNNLNLKQLNEFYFDTILINVNSKKIKKIAEKKGINFNYPDNNHVSISINETTSERDLKEIIDVFEDYTGVKIKSNQINAKDVIPPGIKRESHFLTNKIFNSYQSETSMMRYIKSLERKDLALNHSMISLGSCTMKLNSANLMIPLSFPEWGNIHPFSPINQAEGYQEVLSSLKEMLNEITGFSSTSLQPNSGAQGEFSGLMVIRAYHISNGEKHRNICIIPSSAHGTNPASAVMAGMKVVVTGTDNNGNIDFEELKQHVLDHADNLAALMITYPSTYGVFESNIKSITKLIHENGGQVYMDGANMNAQVGLTSPKEIGADVCHLNLHKTFAIPHGGGGPGVGPISVAKHLEDFLPSNPIVKTGGDKPIESISSAPWGSALACIISYGYIKLLGYSGLRKSTEVAILSANYIKERLDGAFPILYVGDKGRSAHELIIDLRGFKEKNIEVVDLAKRLMDYGFHAPTVSFPVPGTMMIEPTESENLEEIDRFCDAMISIAAEISEKDYHDENSVLKNAPHTELIATGDKWPFKYSRKKALYPLKYLTYNKFWPTVRRVDEAFGDRNLVCSCISTSEFKKTYKSIENEK